MDEWKTSGKSRMPQLVVKIVGGKLMKYFIDGTKSLTDHLEVTNSSTDRNSASNRGTDGDSLKLLRAESNTENFLDALKQAIEPVSQSPDLCLLSCLSEELQDLDQHTFQDMEDGVRSLDPSRSGIVHHAELVNVFLRLKIPVKLSTLDCVFRAFRDSTDPQQVCYKDMLQFIQRAVQNHEQQSVEAENRDASVASTDLESVSNRTDVLKAEEREMWLQRFQKMEMALQMFDTKNTGYVDRDRIKRLILNYSLIFDLNLSPLKVSEVIRDTQREGEVHLPSALEQLKEC